jgi:hypothetical protein
MLEPARIKHGLDHVGTAPPSRQAARSPTEAFRQRDEIRRDAPVLGGKKFARAPRAGHHLVIDQQDAVLVGRSRRMRP